MVQFSGSTIEIRKAYAGNFALPPALPPEENTDKDCQLLFSRILTEKELKYLDHLAGCPVIFQNYVEKQSEIRVTIVGDDVFAAEIHSQEVEETRIDFRAFNLLPADRHPKHTSYSLPKEVESKLVSLMRQLGLVFGCIDLIRTPSGEHVFLEVNPSGQWGWIEGFAGLPITDALVGLLARR